MLSGHSFFEKKATGWSLGMFLNLFDEIAPTPVSEASTSTMTGLEESGLRMGAMVNTVQFGVVGGPVWLLGSRPGIWEAGM